MHEGITLRGTGHRFAQRGSEVAVDDMPLGYVGERDVERHTGAGRCHLVER